MKKILALTVCLFLNSSIPLFSQIIDEAAERAVADHNLILNAEDILLKLKEQYSNKAMARDYDGIYKRLYDYVSRLKLLAYFKVNQDAIQNILNEFPRYK